MKLTQKQIDVINEVKSKLEKINKDEFYDIHEEHMNADDYLCEILTSLGLEDIVIEFNKIDKWYG